MCATLSKCTNIMIVHRPFGYSTAHAIAQYRMNIPFWFLDNWQLQKTSRSGLKYIAQTSAMIWCRSILLITVPSRKWGGTRTPSEEGGGVILRDLRGPSRFVQISTCLSCHPRLQDNYLSDVAEQRGKYISTNILQWNCGWSNRCSVVRQFSLYRTHEHMVLHSCIVLCSIIVTASQHSWCAACSFARYSHLEFSIVIEHHHRPHELRGIPHLLRRHFALFLINYRTYNDIQTRST